MSAPRPDRPTRVSDPNDDRSRDSTKPADSPDHPDDAAILAERAEGAHAEQITDEANLREDPTPPGVDPDDVEDDAEPSESDGGG